MFPDDKFSNEEIDTFEEKFYEWTQMSNEEMHVTNLPHFLMGQGIKFKADEVLQWIVDKVNIN
jgi:hypothetical protein